MPSKSNHAGRRVALAVPQGLYQQIEDWAEAEGRPVASLCMSLIEQGLRAAQTSGLIPSPTEALEDFFRRKEAERASGDEEAEAAREKIRAEIAQLKAELDD